ncbi:MAG: hypothetical protein Q8M86_12970, partial [Syntrophales bacterium]|nr:hypothetical protein [Syntrophales bacterium]
IINPSPENFQGNSKGILFSIGRHSDSKKHCEIAAGKIIIFPGSSPIERERKDAATLPRDDP